MEIKYLPELLFIEYLNSKLRLQNIESLKRQLNFERCSEWKKIIKNSLKDSIACSF